MKPTARAIKVRYNVIDNPSRSFGDDSRKNSKNDVVLHFPLRFLHRDGQSFQETLWFVYVPDS